MQLEYRGNSFNVRNATIDEEKLAEEIAQKFDQIFKSTLVILEARLDAIFLNPDIIIENPPCN